MGSGAVRLAMPQLPGALPFEEEFAEALHWRGIGIFLPDKNQRDMLQRLEQDEFEDGLRCDHRFGDDADPRPGFHIAHDGANETRSVGEPRSNTGLAASG